MDPAIPDEKPSGHEKNDVSIGAVVKFVVWLVVATVGVQLGMWGLFRVLAARSNSIDRPISPMVV